MGNEKMIRKACLMLCAVLAVFFLQLIQASADEVRLANGDRLSGEIISVEKRVLVLKTTYAGNLRIDWSQVACIASERQLSFLVQTNKVVSGAAECPLEGEILIKGRPEGEPLRLPLSELQAVNPAKKPAVVYKGSIVAGGSRTDGNTDSTSFNTSGLLVIRYERNRLTLKGSYNYGETDDTLTARNASGSVKYDRFFNKKLYGYAQTLFERDDLQDLRLRSTYGLGLGYQFIDSDRTSLWVEGGPSYYEEDFTQSEDQQYASGRWSMSFNHDIVIDGLKFFHIHEGYYSFETSDSYYIRSEQGLRIPVAKNFFANFQFNYNYNSQPAPGKRRDDAAYIFGLAYDFEF